MASVTGRIKQIKQPRGGYVPVSSLNKVQLDNGDSLYQDENIPASVVGTVVDYLLRTVMTGDALNSFEMPIKGSLVKSKFFGEDMGNLGISKTMADAALTVRSIKGIDEDSIINACKVMKYDIWGRNPIGAMAAGEQEYIPDKETIKNIQTMVKRGEVFFKKYGAPTKFGFTFDDEDGGIGGYTGVVDSGDGDFLTADTLWELKVYSTEFKNPVTLQLLMYWIMSQRSNRKEFKGLTRIGVFNPRLNKVYTLDIADIPDDVIKAVERDVICY